MAGTASTLTPGMTIDGLIVTSNKCLDNLQKIADACSCFITFDIHTGKWSVVPNTTGTSIMSFNNHNIIGPVNVSATGIDGLYNGVKVTYPHEDLRGMNDFVEVILPSGSWYPSETLNIMNINYGLIRNQVQAQYVGTVLLKQSRVDKVVTFQADFTALGLKGGDLFDITVPYYGWTNKVFRVQTITEDDPDSGEILLTIVGIEYDASVYDTSNLIMNDRIKPNSIVNNKPTVLAAANSSASTIATTAATTAVAPALAAATTANSNSSLALAGLTAALGLIPGAKQNINANYVLLTWQSFDGTDLDIRFTCPDAGMTAISSGTAITSSDNILGYNAGNGSPISYWESWPKTGTPIFSWGGDAYGPLSTEHVFIDLGAFQTAYPAITQLNCECRGTWYSSLGILPVNLFGTMWQGGTPVFSADGQSYYTSWGGTWTNPTATTTANITGESNVLNGPVHSAPTDPSPSNTDGFNGETFPGQLMGYFHYNFTNKQAWFSLSPTS